jgi:hypothetical protein
MVPIDHLSRHLHQNTHLEFIGAGQTEFVNTPVKNNTLYMLDGSGEGLGSIPNAQLFVNSPTTFHGTIDLGPHSGVQLNSIWADSYKFDAKNDLLSLYQGNKVVDTVSLLFNGGATLALGVQSQHAGAGAGNWVYVATSNHGLSYHIPIHDASPTNLMG